MVRDVMVGFETLIPYLKEDDGEKPIIIVDSREATTAPKIIKGLRENGAEIKSCGGCSEARGIDKVPFINGIKLSNMKEFAKLIGESRLQIISRHIIPNVISPVIIYGTLDLGDAILLAAALSFLGLGAQPPLPEWGAMVNYGRDYIMNQWWLSTFPGLACLLLVLGFNLLGDGLRDALDPVLRRTIYVKTESE